MNNTELTYKLKEIASLQNRFSDFFQKILNSECDKEQLILMIEKTEYLINEVVKLKEQHYERTLDWIEEYSSCFLNIIKTKVDNNDFSDISVYFIKLIDCMRKSAEVINEFVEIGIYEFNIGLMNRQKEYSVSDKSSFVRSIDEKTMNPLEHFFFYEKHNFITKWSHYFEVYHKYFQKFRNKPVTILEIGIFGGGSLQMWKNYFGAECNIIGIDIMEQCKNYEEDRIKIYIGSQEDRKFLNLVKKENPSIDIIIDDGGHTMNQQITTFEELFPHLSEDGVYLCEDCMTSYWPKYDGGYNSPLSFIEYSKKFIDKINSRYSITCDLPVDYYTQTLKSIHFHDSMVVFEKGKHLPSMEFSVENK